MSKFSERIGATKPLTIQLGGMNVDLRNSIWNIILKAIDDDAVEKGQVARVLADGFFKVPIDSVVSYPRSRFWEWLRKNYSALAWHDVYNLLEFVTVSSRVLSDGKITSDQLRNHANTILAREMSGYRFVQGVLSPISSEVEVAEIDAAIASANKAGLDGVRTHLSSAIQLLGKKPEPDHRNSIKESISAVESAVKCIAGVQGGGLDAALKVLAQRTELHPALAKGFATLYGYTSDEDGIRHAILEETNVGFDEAKFMLVACSAFVHFLISKAEGAGLLKAQ
jgi:AbiJ-like protein